MADIKVCDRCGKKLDADKRTSFTVKPATNANRYILSAMFFNGRNYFGDLKISKTEHDLCPECTLELSKWLEHESKEETA